METETRKAVIKLAFLFALFCVLIWGLYPLMGTDLAKATLSQVQEHGLPAFFLIITLVNILIVPVSSDILIAAAPTIFSESSIIALVLSIVSPIVSAATDMYFGQRYGPIVVDKIAGKKAREYGEEIVQKYGVAAIALTTITPLPFSLVCWACGTLKLPIMRGLVVVILTRVPRHIIVFYFGQWLLGISGH